MKYWHFALGLVGFVGSCAFGETRLAPERPCSLLSSITHSLPLSGAEARALLDAYNRQAAAVRSLHFEALIRIDGGKEYGLPGPLPDLPAFVDFLAPSFVHLKVPIPLTGALGFELVSDGRDFGLLVPGIGRRTYFLGPMDTPPRSSRPIENLRPSTLVDALRWPEAKVRFETAAPDALNSDALIMSWDLVSTSNAHRTITVDFDRNEGTVRSLAVYDSVGHQLSETQYADWRQVEDSSGSGNACFPRMIKMKQINGESAITLKILRAEMNPQIPRDFFRTIPPTGTPVVRLSALGDASQQ